MKRSASALSDAVQKLRTAFFSVAISSFFINLLMLSGPIYMLQIYDRVLSSKSVSTLLALTILVATLYLLMCVLDILRSYILVRIANNFDNALSEDVYNAAITSRSVKARRNTPIGNLDNIRYFLSGVGPAALMDIPWTPVFLVLIYLLHPTLGLLTTLGTIFIVALVVLNDFFGRRASLNLRQARHDRSLLTESTSGKQETAIAMGMTRRLGQLWKQVNQNYLTIQQQSTDQISTFRSTIKSFRLFLQSALLGLGAYLVIHQEISTGVMIAASIIASRALAPIEQAVTQWRSMIEAFQSYHALKRFLENDHTQAPGIVLPAPSKTLQVNNMSVTSPATGSAIVQGVSFELQAGEGLGIIGQSGGGKSTLIRGLLGVWPRLHGTVALDGSPQDKYDPDQLGQSIGYLPQSVELLTGTIAQNICRFDPMPDSENIIEAARLAGAHETIMGLPEGYDTPIGKTGAALSGGQLQRVGLARALYNFPFLVILDEPNANLDKPGEIALLQAIKTLREKGSIVIIISHRFSGVSQVNKLMIVEKGRMAGYGAKEDILPHVTSPRSENSPLSNRT